MCNFRIAEDRPNPPSLGPTGFPYGQNGNEERIAKILSEANKAMAAGVAAAASKDSVVPITSAAGQVSFPLSIVEFYAWIIHFRQFLELCEV